MRVRGIGVAVCVALLGVLLIATSASAERAYLGEITGAPAPAPKQGPFLLPGALATAADDGIWVNDRERGVTTEFDSTGAYVSQQNGGGRIGFGGRLVSSLAVSHTTDKLHIADGSNVFTFNGNGSYAGMMFNPEGFSSSQVSVAVDNSSAPTFGRLYVAGRVGVYAFDDSTPVDFEADALYVEGNRITGTPSEPFASISDVFVDAEGNILVADDGRRVIDRFSRTGAFMQEITGTPTGAFGGLGGITIDPTSGAILAVDTVSKTVEEFDSEGTYVDSVIGTPGGLFSSPRDVAVNSNGRLYISDAQVVEIFSPSQVRPRVTYESPSAETQTSVTLKAIADPNGGGEIIECHVEYGLTTAYGNSAPCAPSIPPGYIQPTAVSAEISGLAPEQPYHYRFVVSNANVTKQGADHTYIPHYVRGLSTDLPAVSAISAILKGSFVGNGEDTHYYFEWGADTSYGNVTSVPPGEDAGSPDGPDRVDLAFPLDGLDPVHTYHYRIVAENGSGVSLGEDQTFTTLPFEPTVSELYSSGVHSDSAQLHALIGPNGATSRYHFEYVTEAGFAQSGFASALKAPVPDRKVQRNLKTKAVVVQVNGLLAGTIYHWRLVTLNAGGTTESPGRIFTTFPYEPSLSDPCPNALARQQTGAALLLDCRAYELVSAADTDGYDVASDLVPGQSPFGGYPNAQGKALYAVHDGGIQGVGSPTNHGPDPYLATRSPSGWSTAYVGIPADNPYAQGPFASTLDEATESLDAFAFAGPEICSPCFGDGSTGIPLRTKDGNLIQGMAGSIPSADPIPAGRIQKRFSADGNHFLFGSQTKLTDDANEGGDTTIYDRNLATGQTTVVSKTPAGGTMTGPGIDQLDVSADGSRVLIGQEVSIDSEGNSLYRLFINVGGADQSIEVTPGATSGVLYAGMKSDGSAVYFTTADKLKDDTDESADLYRADISASSVELTHVSSGTEGTGDTDSCDPAANSARVRWNMTGPDADCSVLAIGGQGGIATENGSIYFLSPEKLEGSSNGSENAPNLYLARPGGESHFVATLESTLNGPQPPIQSHPFKYSFGSFTTPTGIAADSNGNVYVLDIGDNSVERFDSEGNPVPFDFDPGSKEMAGNKLTGADTPAGNFSEAPAFGLPAQIAVDSNGNLYVPDLFGGVVNKFDTSGNYVAQLGVSFPAGVAVDPTNDDVYVPSFFGFISVFDSSGTHIGELSGFSSPRGVALDSAGILYVVNGSEAAAYDSSGSFIRQLDANPSFGAVVDPTNDDVYVNEGDRIARFDSSGQRLGTEGVGVLSGSVGVALDSAGNLYAANTGKGQAAAFGPLALTPSSSIDNPVVINALSEAETRRTADFQVTPSGGYAAFPTTLSLTGFDNGSHTELFRHAAGNGDLDCVSCAPSGARPTSDASLATNGSSLTTDGRVFFTSQEPLARQDLNNKRDAYEWSQGELGLISSGSSPFDSSLFSVTSDGTDAFFFTREKLAKEDQNGSAVRLYSAREKGGLFVVPSPKPCAASDECHGPSSPQPAPADVKTVAGTAGNVPKVSRCAKGKVKRRGRCVKRQSQRKGKGGKANRNGRAGR